MVALEVDQQHHSVDDPHRQPTIQDPQLCAHCQVMEPTTECTIEAH